MPHSHFYRGGRSRILTYIVVAAELPTPHSYFYRGSRGVADPAFSLLSWWPLSGRPRILTSTYVVAGGRPRIITSIVVVAE